MVINFDVQNVKLFNHACCHKQNVLFTKYNVLSYQSPEMTVSGCK